MNKLIIGAVAVGIVAVITEIFGATYAYIVTTSVGIFALLVFLVYCQYTRR